MAATRAAGLISAFFARCHQMMGDNCLQFAGLTARVDLPGYTLHLARRLQNLSIIAHILIRRRAKSSR